MKIPASKYACPYCQGKGRIEIEGPGMESYASSCPHCHGSGERMIEIPLREYERLVQNKKSIKNPFRGSGKVFQNQYITLREGEQDEAEKSDV